MNPTRPAGPEGPPAASSAADRLLAEISDLAASPVPEDVFLPELLKRAVAALEAEAGALWMYDDERRLVLKGEVRLQSTGFLEDQAFRAAFERPFAEVLQGGGVVAHEAEQATLHDGIRKRSVLLGGLVRQSGVSGLVQIFEARESLPETRPARLRLLEQICSQAARYWRQRLAQGGRPETAAEKAPPDQWTLAVHESLKSAEVAVVAANECRRLMGVDRATIGVRHGPKMKILAVSGQQSVNARSNVVRLLSELTQEVVQTGEKMSYLGDSSNLPPQIEKLLADYLHESRSRALVILPVAGPAPRTDAAREAADSVGKPPPKAEPVGVLVVEQISEAPFPADLETRLERIGPHIGLALHHAEAYETIFLLPLWEFLGSWKAKLKGRRLAQVGAVLAGVCLVALALLVVPWEYRVVGKGRMMPVDRRGIFAPSEGEVIGLAVRSGQPVKKGDLLVRLKNADLQAKLLYQQNQLQEKRKQRASVAAQLAEPAAIQNPATEVELRGKFVQLGIEITGAEQQVENLSREVEKLAVHSPIAGVVATFRIEEMLRERPVKRGDLLLEIMDPAGPWRLELDVPENRLGHVLQAEQKHRDGNLRVRYVLATATEATYDGSLESISTRSVVSETEGSVVPLYAALVEPVPPAPRIGAEVTAKIDCGQRSLGYVLFGDVVEFIRKRFWL
jgi:multidrug efflux pump subunit AcrA (membrane-fusion protein)